MAQNDPGESETAPAQAATPAKNIGAIADKFSISFWLAMGVPLLCILLAIIEGSSYLWRPISIVLYAILLLFALFLTIAANLSSDTTGIENNTLYFAFTMLGSIALLVGFSQISRHLSITIGGFTSAQTGYWHWLRFGFSNLLESALFDIPSIYQWNISEIVATSTWSRTIIFLFRFTLEFIVVAMVLRQAKSIWKKRDRTLGNSAQNYFGMILPTTGGLVLAVLWGLPIAIGIGAVVNDGFSLDSTLSAIKTGAPVVLGFLLAWNSLRGLRVHGLGNKLLALAGIVGGCWLIQNFWPALRLFLGL